MTLQIILKELLSVPIFVAFFTIGQLSQKLRVKILHSSIYINITNY